MIDHVTHETSQLLKNAGFPQPEITVGQFWYAELEYKGGELEHSPLCIVVENYSTRKKSLRRLTCEKMTGEQGGRPHVFAPSAADILKELGKRFMLNHVVSSDTPAFVVLEWAEAGISTIRIMREWIHTNSAEAAAACWLQINEMK